MEIHVSLFTREKTSLCKYRISFKLNELFIVIKYQDLPGFKCGFLVQEEYFSKGVLNNFNSLHLTREQVKPASTDSDAEGLGC